MEFVSYFIKNDLYNIIWLDGKKLIKFDMTFELSHSTKIFSISFTSWYPFLLLFRYCNILYASGALWMYLRKRRLVECTSLSFTYTFSFNCLQLAKMKKTWPRHEIYRDEAVGIKKIANILEKLRFLWICGIWGNFLKIWYFVNNCLIEVRI